MVRNSKCHLRSERGFIPGSKSLTLDMALRISLILAFVLPLCGCVTNMPPAIQEALIRTNQHFEDCKNNPVPVMWDATKREWVIDQRRALHERAGCPPISH